MGVSTRSSSRPRRIRKMSSPTKPEHPLIEDVDPMASFFYTPRALTVMTVGLLALAYFSDALGLDPQRGSWESRVKGALWALVGAFLGYSALYAPHTFMIRPHPIVWKLVHGVTLLYIALPGLPALPGGRPGAPGLQVRLPGARGAAGRARVRR